LVDLGSEFEPEHLQPAADSRSGSHSELDFVVPGSAQVHLSLIAIVVEVLKTVPGLVPELEPAQQLVQQHVVELD
jgi:hypothetical protein